MDSKPIPLPLRGINKGVAVCYVPDEYSSDMLNVRPIDVLEKRVRLGKRPGLKKWGAGTQIGSAEQPVVCICSVSSVS
jgi:hypothetical protein